MPIQFSAAAQIAGSVLAPKDNVRTPMPVGRACGLQVASGRFKSFSVVTRQMLHAQTLDKVCQEALCPSPHVYSSRWNSQAAKEENADKLYLPFPFHMKFPY